VNSEEFLASHIIRIPGVASASTPSVKQVNGDGPASLRETRAKAKQYTTLNGRTIVLKDSFLYSNKGMTSGRLLFSSS
jgi:hypothetical protein